MKSARECPCSRSSAARSSAISSSRLPRNRIPQICRNASSAPRPARRSAPSSSGSFTARRRPMIREAGSNASAGAVRCSAEHVRRPYPVPDRHPSLARQDRRDQIVRIVPVPPADDLVRLERLAGGGIQRQLPLELRHHQHGSTVRPDHEGGQALQRHRAVAGQVDEIGRRGHHHGRQPVLGQLGGQPLPSRLVVGRHSFSRIDRGITWNVAGVVPSISPSATTGRGRSASIDTRIFARISRMCGCGTWSP